MTKPVAPNHRDAKCCMTCKFYASDYDGDGQCTEFITNDSDKLFRHYSHWYQVCDNYKEEEDND